MVASRRPEGMLLLLLLLVLLLAAGSEKVPLHIESKCNWSSRGMQPG
jgi:hypothetical protein